MRDAEQSSLLEKHTVTTTGNEQEHQLFQVCSQTGKAGRCSAMDLVVHISFNSNGVEEKDARAAGMLGQNGETLSVHIRCF